MSERKVLNKYYPPDYDPSKIPKGKRNKNATFNIRIMAPFNMRCNMCKEYIYKGKKFNSRKEDVMDEDYLGLRIFRFYIKCPRCVSEIAFKTDLENTDYTLEAGAKRLFEAEKIAQQMAQEERKAKEEEEMNPMKLLENRTKASRQEMEQIDTLEELREMNTRKNLVNTDEMIEKYRKYEEMLQKLQMDKEEEEINEIFGNKSGQVVRRLEDSDEEAEPVRKKLAVSSSTKPTDILAEGEKNTDVPQAAPKVWQKSVGSLSSKQKLKGLVTVKRKAPLSTASATVTSASSENNSTNSDSQNLEKKANGDSDKLTDASKGTDTGESADSANTKSDTAKETVKLSSDTTATGSTQKKTETVKGGSSNGVQVKTSALSMLGAYPDSDSSSSSE